MMNNLWARNMKGSNEKNQKINKTWKIQFINNTILENIANIILEKMKNDANAASVNRIVC